MRRAGRTTARPVGLSGTIGDMTDQTARYDRIAEGYARWWGPIIAPAAVAALDEIADAVRDGATEILDVGTGTGTLAIAAVRRWPMVHVIGIDASSGMIETAGRAADEQLTAEERRRLDLRVAFADELGLPDESIHAAMSSFVLQLVPNRHRALRDVRRVLRPRGVFGWVSWMTGSEPWRPDDDFDDALIDIGEEPREWDDRPGDLRDERSAVAEMRRAGFAEVSATAGRLVHGFDVDGVVGFLTEFDEEDLVDSLGKKRRREFESALRRRLERRPAAELAIENRTVTVRGIRR
jgi:SAM-dependent methyltransferase